MHFQISFFSMIIIILNYKISIAKEAKSRSTFFEPCLQDCLLGITRLSNSNHFLFFYKQHYLELDLDNLLIVTFRKHADRIWKLTTEKSECKFYSLHSDSFLICDNEKYQYDHRNQALNSLKNYQSKLVNKLSNFNCTLSIDNNIFLFLNDEKSFLCNDSDDCESSNNFLTPYHLNKCKSAFLTNNSIAFFTDNYFLHLKLKEDKLKSRQFINPEEIQIIKNYEGFITEMIYTSTTKRPSMKKLNETIEFIEPDQSTKTSKESKKLAEKLIDQLLKDKKSVKKIFYKNLFGCSIINSQPEYYLPFNRNLIDYHSNKRLYLTNDFISIFLNVFYSLTIFIFSALLITKFLNSRLITAIEHLLCKPRLSEQDTIFLQVRTEIENGVCRKLEKSDMSPKEINKSEIRILIDTLLHEQLYVNLLNLDALKSVDLIRHLINEVVETIKVRRSERSREMMKKKIKNHYSVLDSNLLLGTSNSVRKSKLADKQKRKARSGSKKKTKNNSSSRSSSIRVGRDEIELDDLKMNSKSTKSKLEVEFDSD